MTSRWRWWQTDGARVLLLACVAFLFLFQAPVAMRINVRNWFADDGCYIQHLGDYIGIVGEHICKVTADGGGAVNNYYSQGAPILWIVPGLIGKGIAHLLQENVTSWVLAFVAFTSYAFWFLSLFFILKSVKLTKDALPEWARWPLLISAVILLNVPSLHYSVARPFMAHSAEAMLAFGLVYTLLLDRYLFALLFCVLLLATRYNDAPALLLFLGRILDRAGGPRKVLEYWAPVKRSQKITIGVGLAALVAVTGWILFFVGYSGTTAIDIFNWVDWKYALTFLFSPTWGVLWTGTWWLFSVILGIVFIRRLSYMGVGALLWMISQALICLAWGGNGGDFAYRYLIGSYAAALVVWIDVLRAKPVLSRGFAVMTAVCGVWMLFLATAYNSIPGLVATWQSDGTCYIPPDIAIKVFGNIFNGDVYRFAAARQFAPMVVWLSRHPEAMPPKATFRPLDATLVKIYLCAIGACAVYALGYLGFWIANRRKAQWPAEGLSVRTSG